MFQTLFQFDYNTKNIRLFLENAFLSAFAANILEPAILFYLTYNFLDTTLLSLWFALVLFIFLFRIFIIKKLHYFLSVKSDKVKPYFKVFVGLLFVNAFLNLYIIILSISQGIPTTTIFIFSTMIVTITAGSVSTLIGVFHVYLYFVILNMVSFIGAILYFGGEEFYLFAFILAIFTILILKIGLKQYRLIDKITLMNETFQTIYESSPDGIILIQNNRFKDCNSSVVKMFGYDTKEDLLSTHVSAFMPKYQDDGSLSMRKMLQMVKVALKEGHHTFEWKYIKKDKTPFWVEFVLTKIYVDGEELLHAVYRDITKRKELEKEKAQFQESLKKQVAIEVENNRKKDEMMLYQSRLAQMGEMINMIAHQWRQPLNAITIATGAIHLKAQKNKLNTETAIELSDNIKKFAFHLSATIDDFRNFFKTNKVTSITDFKKLIESVLLITESSLKNNQIDFQLEIKKLAELNTFENEMKQVLLNLVKNAQDALKEQQPNNPYIKVLINGTTISVSDNAGGIDESILEKIFEPYFSTKTKKDGTGLGLYMSKVIVEDHCGGKLSVNNTQEGACFTITLEGEKNA